MQLRRARVRGCLGASEVIKRVVWHRSSRTVITLFHVSGSESSASSFPMTTDSYE